MQQTKLYTLCLVYDNDRILLGMKKCGFGMRRWNGVFHFKDTDTLVSHEVQILA